jgi:short-subunit dehydrogenase
MKEKVMKTVLVTGSSRGIGYSVVELLASKNFKIYAGVRTITNATELNLLAKKNTNVKILEIDLQNYESIKNATNAIKKDGPKIDVIINSAGVIVFGPVETVSPNQFQDQFQINLFGPILLTQELLPLMRTQKAGHIIFLGSTSGVESHGMYGAYAASKFALEAICHSLAVNLYRWKIKVSLVELSATATSIAEKSLQIGNRFQRKPNPYARYTQNRHAFLKALLASGMPPQKTAEKILELIENPKDQLRFFVSQKSKKIFKHSLRDYSGRKWKKEAKEESALFE